jgi:DNA-binding HxlR family transcriptional regulator
MRTYGQYCPIARAAEILGERWTPIIVRNLMAGCRTYSEISAGAPGLSHSLLTQRLRQLTAAGIIQALPKDRGIGQIYLLTDAGQDLSAVLSALGAWGERWLELRDEQANPRFLLWAWSTAYLAHDQLPDRRVVVRFEFTDQPPNRRRIWMLFDRRRAEVCLKPPGFDEDLIVETEAITLARWHIGQLEWSSALRSGAIRITGSRPLARALPTWNHRHHMLTPTTRPNALASA